MSDSGAVNIYAAVDLGSNSFHMVVARVEHGDLRIIDRIKDMVRLAAGVDESGDLAAEVRQRALRSLARLGQRLRVIPTDNIRAVATQAFRRLNDAEQFLLSAEAALGCPIEIIGGLEEARLIYTGVSQGVAGFHRRRLVMDIGGGSTELVIGDGTEPILLESLQYGCVAVTQKYFPSGELTPRQWKTARNAVRADLQELLHRYLDTGWDRAVGSSGTIRAVFEVAYRAGWCDKAITATAVKRLKQQLLRFGHIDNIKLDGLTQRRLPVFAGGVVILDACFKDLGFDEMHLSPYALREGVLYDLLGRLEHKDPRDKTIDAFALRYGVDLRQAERVRDTALALYEHLAEPFGLREIHRNLLEWACRIHETGLSIAHSSYQKHSGYLVKHSDMAGFSRLEQHFLSALLRYHRRPLDGLELQSLPPRLYQPAQQLLMMLRIAVILCRTRDDSALPDLMITAENESVELSLPESWMQMHPLTMNDLHQEAGQLARLGFDFKTKPLAIHELQLDQDATAELSRQ